MKQIQAMKDNKIIRDELIRIHKQKGLTPQNVVESARSKSNPLHNIFEWDDSIAAKKWRLQQARLLINIVVIPNEKHVPLFESVKITINDAEERRYLPSYEILDNNEYRQQVVDQAVQWLISFRNKYKRYTRELKPALDGIDKVIKKWQKKKKKEK